MSWILYSPKQESWFFSSKFYKRCWEKFHVTLTFSCGVLLSSWFLRNVFMILDVNPICLYYFCRLNGKLSYMSRILVVGISKSFLFAKMISWDHIQACTSLLKCYSNALSSWATATATATQCLHFHSPPWLAGSPSVYVWLSCYGNVGLTEGTWHFFLLFSLLAEWEACWCWLFVKCSVGFPREAIWSLASLW